MMEIHVENEPRHLPRITLVSFQTAREPVNVAADFNRCRSYLISTALLIITDEAG